MLSAGLAIFAAFLGIRVAATIEGVIIGVDIFALKFMAKAAQPVMMAKASSERDWWIPALALGPLVLYLYGPTLVRLIHHWWQDPNFGHGFLVPFFSGFVVWKRRTRLAVLPRRPSWAGLVVVIFSLAMLVAGVLGAELFLARTSFIILLAGLTILLCGPDYFRALLFPWACLFLMVPIPTIVFNQVTFPLQLLSSHLASSALSLVGVPVLRDGNIIHLPAMALEVAQACSGIRSLMSLVTLSVIYGYLSESRLLVQVILALAAIPIAVAANGLRIVGTGLLVQYGNAGLAEGFFHSFSGWLLFVLSLGILFVAHKTIRAALKI
jgi:exosortase